MLWQPFFMEVNLHILSTSLLSQVSTRISYAMWLSFCGFNKKAQWLYQWTLNRTQVVSSYRREDSLQVLHRKIDQRSRSAFEPWRTLSIGAVCRVSHFRKHKWKNFQSCQRWILFDYRVSDEILEGDLAACAARNQWRRFMLEINKFAGDPLL